MSQRTIIVTGGAGFIGANLVRLLVAKTDYRVVVVDKLTYAGNLASIADLVDDNRLTFHDVDICNEEAIRQVFEDYQPSGLMHLAAESHVDRSIDGPATFVQTNVVGTFTLLNAAQQFVKTLADRERDSFRFLHVSTDEVYGSLGLKDPAFTEDTPYDPHSPYSATKASSDHLVRAWHDTHRLPVIVTNCSNNYGPYQFPEKLIPVVILKALRGEPIPVYGNGENIRDWLYVEDHARALLAAFIKGDPGETYNIGGNNEQQNIELVRQICGMLDEIRPREDGGSYQTQIEFVTDRPGHDLRYGIDSTKIQSKLGWKPQEDFASGFRKTVQWYLDNEGWWQSILSGEYKLERQGVQNSNGA